MSIKDITIPLLALSVRYSGSPRDLQVLVHQRSNLHVLLVPGVADRHVYTRLEAEASTCQAKENG